MDEYLNIDTPAVPKSFEQLGVLVLDGSGSMGEETEGKITKAQAVNLAVRELLSRLQASRQKQNFSIGIVTFDAAAATHTPIAPVVDLDAYGDYDPQKGHGGDTDIAEALRQAEHLAATFLYEADPEMARSVVIVLMTDGETRSDEDALAVAEELKSKPGVSICTTLFATLGEPNVRAQALLKAIASDANSYRTVYDAEGLRAFFIASVSTVARRKIIEQPR